MGDLVKACQENLQIEDEDENPFKKNFLFDVSVTKLKIDLLTIASHKFYGPKGVGAIYIKDGILVRLQMEYLA